MSQRKGLFTAVRAAAVALTIGGATLMGHSGVDAARAATTADSPAGSPVLAAPASTSADCDRKKSDDKAKPDITGLVRPAEKDSSTDKPDKDKDEDKSDSDKDRKDKADDDKDKDKKDEETCTTSSTTTTSVGSISVPPPAAPPATGVKAVSAKAPVTAVPKTGAEVPFAAGLLLTTAGAGALIAARRRRRSE
ncbi:MAG: hypothetical protein QOE72_1501 [Chloroflexota bacterium]|jgi:hypothetical protein|nr:hypothetical protein [Chloroflexota bacterium]